MGTADSMLDFPAISGMYAFEESLQSHHFFGTPAEDFSLFRRPVDGA
jgi:hypothetical protein